MYPTPPYLGVNYPIPYLRLTYTPPIPVNNILIYLL